MRNFTLLTILLVFSICSSMKLSAQEVAQEKTTKYVFDLNAIKHQSQVDGVTMKTEQIEHVEYCQLNWLDYQLIIHVKEGGDYGVFSLEKLKAILIEHKVDLINFKKEIITP